MALDTIQTISAVVGTAIVLQRATSIDLRNPEPVDVATVLAVAYGTRMVVDA